MGKKNKIGNQTFIEGELLHFWNNQKEFKSYLPRLKKVWEREADNPLSPYRGAYRAVLRKISFEI